jgi:hypothetical protein
MAKVTAKNIDKEFSSQGVEEERLPSVEARDALAQTATGILNASLGAPGVSQDKIREQVIAHVVFAYNRRPDPRDVHASQLPKLVADLLKKQQDAKPSKEVVAALAKMAVGFLRESENPLPAPAKLIAVQGVVQFYVAGA